MPSGTTPTILDLCREAFDVNCIYTPPFILERVLSGVGCHLANLANMIALENGKVGIRKHGSPENFRQHVCLIIPSGFGKSTILRTLFGSQTGLLSDQLQTSIRGTFSTESWLGTQSREQGSTVTSDGVFQRYKRGIVAADEYARLAILMSGDGIANDEVYLLTALDTAEATKDLSSGSIEVTGIGTTIMPGLRIPHAPLTMTSGLSRRFTIELFLPTLADARVIKELNRMRGERVPTRTFASYRHDVGQLVAEFLGHYISGFPPQLKFDHINKWCDTRDIPHFEEDIYRRLALGYSVVAGTFPTVPLTAELEYMFENEITTRLALKSDVLAEAVLRIVKSSPTALSNGIPHPTIRLDVLSSFLRSYYQMKGIEIRAAIAASRNLGVRIDLVGGAKSLIWCPSPP